MTDNPLPLRDLHLPEAVGWWPLAPGWWFLIAIFVVLCAWAGLRGWRRWQRAAPRRFALRELADCERAYRRHGNAVRLAADLSVLLRRGMLAYAPRGEVAGLTGEAWLEWLDRGMPLPYFHTEAGRSLLTLPYRRPQDDVPDADVDALLAAVRMRLSVPLGEPA